MLANQDKMTNTLLPALEALTPNGSCYLNEGDFRQPDWQAVFYGDNYEKLNAIKDKYDPHHTFWAVVSLKDMALSMNAGTGMLTLPRRPLARNTGCHVEMRLGGSVERTPEEKSISVAVRQRSNFRVSIQSLHMLSVVYVAVDVPQLPQYPGRLQTSVMWLRICICRSPTKIIVCSHESSDICDLHCMHQKCALLVFRVPK